MTPAARSLFVFGLYLLATGSGLLFAPAVLLAPLQMPVPPDAWLRVCGMLVLFLGAYYLAAARTGAATIIALSVWVRASVVLFFGAFVAAGLAPPQLMLFAAVDLAAALWTAWALRGARVGLVAALLVLVGTQASAAPVTFSASFDAESNIVEVLDPAVPVVRVQTQGLGSGVFDLLQYFSSDVVNMASGQGQGTNRYVDDRGDALFGSFSVQLVPGVDPGAFSLVGLVDFIGGIGRFAGATGQASLSGSGQFTSPTHALTHFDFRGSVNLVDEPAVGWMVVMALASALAAGRRRRLGLVACETVTQG